MGIIINESERKSAYTWANETMQRMFPQPDHKIMTGIGTEDDYDVLGTNTAVFSLPNQEKGILMVYWAGENLVKFSVLENAGQLIREHPEVTGRLLRNGLEVARKLK